MIWLSKRYSTGTCVSIELHRSQSRLERLKWLAEQNDEENLYIDGAHIPQKFTPSGSMPHRQSPIWQHALNWQQINSTTAASPQTIKQKTLKNTRLPLDPKIHTRRTHPQFLGGTPVPTVPQLSQCLSINNVSVVMLGICLTTTALMLLSHSLTRPSLRHISLERRPSLKTRSKSVQLAC